MTPEQTLPATMPSQILHQIEDVQRDQVLDDDAILALPHLVVALPLDSDTWELIERYDNEADAIGGAARLATANESYDEVTVTTLAQIGYGPNATVTELPARTSTEAAEPEPDEKDDDADEDLVDPDGQTALIDRSQYDREDLAIPKIDGESVDRIAVSFSGQVFLERSNPEHVALYNALKFGSADIPALRVVGRCSGTAGKMATDKGGSLDVVVGTKTYKVEAVTIPAGEA